MRSYFGAGPLIVSTGSWAPTRWAAKETASGDIDVIVTDARLRQALVTTRSLGWNGLTIGAVECGTTGGVPTFASRWCAATARVVERDVDPDLMVRQIIDLASASSKDVVVIPNHDGTIDAIQEHRAEIEAHCVVALGAHGPLETASDKRATLEVARRLGIRAPDSVMVTGEDEIEDAIEAIPMPAVLKPVRSWVVSGRQSQRLGVRLVRSENEARDGLRAMLGMGAVVLVQTWIPGERLAISFVHSEGHFHGEFAQVAHRMLPLIGGDSVMRESVPVPDDAGKEARRLVSEIELDGYAEVEFRRDVDGTPVLMEINPRLSASIECALRSGVDFPGLVRAWATDQLRSPVGSSYRTGVRVRWLSADVKWLIDNARLAGAPDTVPTAAALASFFRDFGRPTSYDYFDRRDLRPAMVALGADLAWLARSIREWVTGEDRRR